MRGFGIKIADEGWYKPTLLFYTYIFGTCRVSYVNPMMIEFSQLKYRLLPIDQFFMYLWTFEDHTICMEFVW